MKKFLPLILIILFLFAGCGEVDKQSPYAQTEETSASAEVPAEQPATSDEVIKIGFIGPLTGDIAGYGNGAKHGVELALKEIAEKYGKKYEVIYEDDACDPVKTVSAFYKLVNNDQVKVILNNTCSGPTLAIAPLAEERKIVLFSGLSTSKDITPAGDYIFRDVPSDNLKTKLVARYLLDQGIKKIATVNLNNDWATSFVQGFSTAYQEKGGEVIFKESYNLDTLDFRAIISQLNDLNPDSILAATHFNDGGLLFKQLLENGFTGQVFGAIEDLNDPNIINVAKNAMDKIVYFPPLKYEGKEAQEFEKNYKAMYGEKAVIYSYEAYDGMYLIHRAIEERGYDSDGIRDYLYTVKDYIGASGKITIDENGDVKKPFAIMQFEGTTPKQIGILE